MGQIRNGARTFLNILAKSCKLSHMPGFRTGIIGIMGPERASDLFAVWDPLCAVVDQLVALDQWFNQIDYVAEATGDEDLAEAI